MCDAILRELGSLTVHSHGVRYVSRDIDMHQVGRTAARWGQGVAQRRASRLRRGRKVAVSRCFYVHGR